MWFPKARVRTMVNSKSNKVKNKQVRVLKGVSGF